MKKDADEPTQGQSAKKRPYRMAVRGRRLQETRERILKAAYELWIDCPYDEMSLDAVAQRAGVSRQTVHRQFGSKDELIIAVTNWRGVMEEEAVQELAPGDIDNAVKALVARYEAIGDAIVRFLELEGRHQAIDHLLHKGREGHKAWIEHIFGPWLPSHPHGARRRATLEFYAATDVTVWKLLRRDHDQSASETEAIILRLVNGVLRSYAASTGEDKE